MEDLIIRFLIGGLVVSAFATLGDLFKPKTFAGLFGAAPSVALATLALTVAKNGAAYAAAESQAMLFGAIAFFAYAQFVCWRMLPGKSSAMRTTMVFIPVWFAIAFGIYFTVRIWQ